MSSKRKSRQKRTLKPKSRHKKKSPGHIGHTFAYRPDAQRRPQPLLQQSVQQPVEMKDAHVDARHQQQMIPKKMHDINNRFWRRSKKQLRDPDDSQEDARHQQQILAEVKKQMRDPDDAQVGYDDILYDGHVGYEDIFNPNYKMLNLNEHLPYQSNTYEIDPIYALSSAMLTIILCSITVCCLLLCLLAGVSIGFNIRKMKINKQYIQSDSVDNNNEV
eukprot:362661_1